MWLLGLADGGVVWPLTLMRKFLPLSVGLGYGSLKEAGVIEFMSLPKLRLESAS